MYKLTLFRSVFDMNPYITEVIALDLPIISLLLILAWLLWGWLIIPFHYIITFIQKDCNALLYLCKNSQFKHPVECSLFLNAVVYSKAPNSLFPLLPCSFLCAQPHRTPSHFCQLCLSLDAQWKANSASEVTQYSSSKRMNIFQLVLWAEMAHQ